MQANGQCCEDNPDALTHHEVLLPGHLLLKFLKEQLEGCLEAFRAQVRGAGGRCSMPCCACVGVVGGWESQGQAVLAGSCQGG